MAKQKKDSISIYKFITVVAITLAVIYLAQNFFMKSNMPPPASQISELSTDEYTQLQVQVAVSGNDGIVTLTSKCYELSAHTELSQVESIANGLQHKIGFRPNTHDLMRDILNSFNVEVLMVKIVDMQNNTFIGRLILKQGDKIVSLDSKPSDDIALAVRVNASIYIKDDLLKTQGKYTC